VRATLFTPEHPLWMARGQDLNHVEVEYETYGELSPARDNAVFVCHALTGDSHADKWWASMVGPGKPVDTDRFFVVCPNLLGGCQGTTGPSSVNPDTGRVWGLDFPLLDMADFVSVHRALGRHLGVTRWHAVIGGSLGGMQVLQWALTFPEEVANAVVIAASSRLTAQNIAFSAVGRQAIMRDENFDGGQFAAHGHNPDVGLATARMMAHITYLSEQAFGEKFGRNLQHDEATPGFGVDFAVEGYLAHQGEAFLSRFDALSYLYLSRVMDYFDPFADAHALDKVREHPVNFLAIGFTSDWRFDLMHSRRIVRRLVAARQPVSFRAIESPWGHDSFLLDVPGYQETVRAFLRADGIESDKPIRADLGRVAQAIRPGSRVLDLGCGDGELLAHLIAEKGCQGTGVERDPESVLAAVTAGVPVVEFDVTSQLDQFADCSYDVVVLSRTLQAIRNPVEVLHQMARIGRRLIVTMPNFGYWRNRLRLALGHMPMSKDLPYEWYDTPNMRYTTLLDLDKLFAAIGLKVVRRAALDERGELLRLGFHGANLLAGAAIYVLERDDSR
jgi:homoserine O-acetyltransferase